MQGATDVAYANVEQCGNWRNHSLADAQRIAREILARRSDWLDAACA
jgi:S-ribosylhomocysteine lyase LuxS involved in autoinducer biosynthesis